MAKPLEPPVEELSECGGAGEPAAAAAFDRLIGRLGRAVAVVCNLIDPDAGYVTYEGTGSGKVDHRTTLAERVGPRARSRLFEMCRVIKMPSLGDYRVRKQSA